MTESADLRVGLKEMRVEIAKTAALIGDAADQHKIYNELTPEFIRTYGEFNVIVGICQMIRKGQIKVKTERVSRQRNQR